MPKKSRRSKAKHRAKLAKIARERNSQQVDSPVADSSILAKRKIPEVQIPDVRYGYVKPELRRIGILSGSIILVLVVLFFILG
jgi:hypothetical protein